MKKINKLGKVLLLIDYNNVLYKSIYVNLRLTNKGKFTGGLYGFIRQLIKSVEMCKPNHIIICKDTPPYLRKEKYADYKGNRNKDEEFIMKLSQSKKFVDEFLIICGIQSEECKGHEADDLIAQVVNSYVLKFEKIVIKSNDTDLFQLFKYKNIVLEQNKGKYYNRKNFDDEYDITCKQWVDVIAMAGGHNNLPKIKGVGIKTGLKIIKNSELFEKYYIDNKEIIDLNRQLIKLPYKKLNINVEKSKGIDSKLLRTFLATHNIRIRVEEISRVLEEIY